MPVYLKEIDDFRQLEMFRPVLIVPCRFCPAASMAATTKMRSMRNMGGNQMAQVTDQTGDTMFDEKIETLIAIGAAAACNCIPCFEHLYEKAISCGLAAEQIRRASDIAGRVKKGANAAISGTISELVGNKEIPESHCMQTAGTSCCS